MKEVTASQTFDQLTAGEAVGIDVREDFEWQAGRANAPNMVFNPISNFDPDKLPQDKPIIFICRSGNRSGQVTEHLATFGLDVANMVGGMQSWESAGLPMTSDAGKPYVA